MNRKRILHYALIVLLLTWSNAYSQSGPGKSAARGVPGSDQPPAFGKLDNSMLPHSPEAEAIVKYTMLPVTLYTGMPQISVPIYEIKGKNLSIPISLTYNYNGFKPAEVASRFGLGWNLQGAGAITRVVNGRVDGDDVSVVNQFDDYVDFNRITRKQVVLRDMADGLSDGEPDLYIFNCNGLSGKFIWMHGQAYMFPHQNIRIEKYGDGFLITAEDGTKYSFQAYETRYKYPMEGSLPVPLHKSAWFISEIISSDLRDTVKYNYYDDSYSQQPPFMDVYKHVLKEGYPSLATHNWEIVGDVATYITTKNLASITYKQTKIEIWQGENRTDHLPADPSVGAIAVTNVEPGSAFSKLFRLTHDYQNSKLNLRSVEVTNALDTSRSQWYKFEYEGGLGSNVGVYDWKDVARSVDKYGYYNGAPNTNRMMFEFKFDYSPYTAPLADRSVNEFYSKTNMLKKMTYPTGGYTSFEYEKNLFGINNDIDGSGLRVKKISFFDNTYADSASLIKEYAYSSAKDFHGTSYWDNIVTTYNEYCASVEERNIITTTLRSGPGTLTSDLLNNPFYYEHVTETNRSVSASGITEYEFRSFQIEEPDVYLYQKTDKAYKNGSLVPVKKQVNINSLTRKQSFTGSTSNLIMVAGCTDAPTDDPTQNVAGVNQLYRFGHAGFYQSAFKRIDEVIDSTWDSNGLNPIRVAKKYYYDNPSYNYPTRVATADAFGDSLITYMRYPQDYLPSGVASRYSLDSLYKAISDTANAQYDACYNSLEYALRPYQPFISHSGMFSTIANSYHCESDYKAASSVVFNTRDTAIAQHYRGLANARATSTVPRLKALYWMQENNVMSPVIETYTVRKIGSNEFMLSATRNEYGLFASANGSIAALPVGSSQLEVDNYLQKTSFLANADDYYIKQTQVEYDSVLNVAAQWKINDAKQAFLWSYNNQYPVAVVTNAAATDIAYSSFESDGKGNWQYSTAGVTRDLTTITGDYNYNLTSGNISRAGLGSGISYRLSYWLKNGSGTVNINGGGGGAAITSRNGWTLYQQTLAGVTNVSINGSGIIDEVRLHPVNSKMSSYTFAPLIGMSSATDANNKILYYEYDAFMRVALIRDENRNILKQYCYKFYNDSTQPCSEVNIAANWVNSGNTTCQTGTGSYLTGHQLQTQIDENRNSPTFNQSRIADLGLNTTACPVNADWAATGNLRCVKGAGNYNTGGQEREELDNNPYSGQGIRWVSNGSNPTACPVSPDWAATGNLRCVKGTGNYNTGGQEREELDNNPYSGQGTRWVSNGINNTACPVNPDWAATGNLRCVKGTGNYNTGGQEREELDNNPYSGQGTRWVSNGTNNIACPVNPDWAATGNLRCVKGSGNYNTGGQEREELDNNPYSGQGTRWVSNGSNPAACPVNPDWVATGTYQCVTGTGGFATGEQQQQQLDNNPYSGLGYRWVSVGTNYTACPLVPSYTNTGNTRCVTNTGYNTGVQEVEQQDVNPYTAYGTRWVYGSVNYSACPVQEDWVNTGGYTCVQGTGSYRTGEQTVEQYDQNPVTRAGYRWVSGGQNTSACPVTPDWTNTSNYRCVTGSGYNTGQQERQQYDQNPYSGQGYRWVNVGASSACPVTPDWATTGNYRCVTGSGYNTGQQEAEQYDINPYSAQGTRWVSNGTNTSACPVTPNWVTTGNYRCVTGSGYNTGGQEAEQYDANPYSAQGTRWVSNGTNTSACPITPDWNNTGIVRCVTSSGYNTGEQEREQSDHNPYSALGTRWLSNGTNNTACPVTPDWVNQGSPVCEKVTGVENTGYQLQKQTDQNPVTNLGIRWVNIGQNLTACPLIVYVQLSYENMFETFDGYVYADVKLSFYHNSAMTIPAYGNGLTINYEISENCNSSSEVIEGDGEYMYLQKMALLVSPAWSCPVDYWLLTGDGYYIVY